MTGVVLFVANCSRSPDPSREGKTLEEIPFATELQSALDQALQAGQGNHDLGISAAVHLPGYAIWTGVSGNSQPGDPVTPDMLFDAGSIAKTFEAALALSMAEEGLLRLDDPISTWLPAYPNVDGEVTLRQLLNHTSGIFNVFEHPDFPWVGPDVDYAKQWDTRDVFDVFVREPYGPPGAVQHYSSTNYLLVTVIIEKAAGASVPEEVERRFLTPLNLSRTVFSDGAPLPPRFPMAHPWVDVDLDGDLEDLSGIPIAWKVSLTHPVLFTTAEDLVKWTKSLHHDHAVLSEESLREMTTFPAVAVPDPEGRRYGLGIVDFTDEDVGMRVFGHGGSALGFCAFALYLPDYGATVAWVANTGESPQALAADIMGHTWKAISDVLRANLDPQSVSP